MKHHKAHGGHLYHGHDDGPTEHDHLKHGGKAHHGHHGHHHGKHHRKDGGRTEMKVSGNPDVFAEAHDKHGTEKKHGGRAKHHGKHHGHHKHHKATGGAVQVGLMTGGAVRPRLDKPGRKKGGRVGADHSPLSSAHHGHGDGHETPNSRDTYGGTPP